MSRMGGTAAAAAKAIADSTAEPEKVPEGGKQRPWSLDYPVAGTTVGERLRALIGAQGVPPVQYEAKIAMLGEGTQRKIIDAMGPKAGITREAAQIYRAAIEDLQHKAIVKAKGEGPKKRAATQKK